MKSTWALTAVSALVMASRTGACLWDRDTLAEEATGRLDVVVTAVGAFNRNPARYYELRAQRVARELENPNAPASLYDDCAVALDRTGHTDEAIALMLRKRAAVDRIANRHERNDQEYRRLANLGTFYAHRWFASRDRAAGLNDLRESIRLIREAITLNPKAHFGREKYQLLLLEWLVNAFEHPLVLTIVPGTDLRQVEFDDRFVDRPGILDNPEDAIRGLCGLIQLGSGWESIDVFESLTGALFTAEHGSLAILAKERAVELERLGQRSNNPHFDELRAAGDGVIHVVHAMRPQVPPSDPDRNAVINFAFRARAMADRNNQTRTEFMMRQFALGKHPDTHPDFWVGAPAPEPLPPMPSRSLLERLALMPSDNPVVGLGLFVLLVVALSSLVILRWRALKRRTKDAKPVTLKSQLESAQR